MAVQTVNNLFGSGGRAGLNVLALEVPADGGLTEKWPTQGNEFLEVSTVATGTTLTLVYNGVGNVVDGVALANKTVVIGTNARIVVGPFPTNLYMDSTGNMNISWSSAATVKLAVFRLLPQS